MADDAGTQRGALLNLLAGLRRALDAASKDRQAAERRRRSALQRKLLLGVELLCKLEEQVVLPALGGLPDSEALREIDMLRDLSALVQRTTADQRDLVLSVLDGIADVHAARVEALLMSVDVSTVPWAALVQEMRGLLGRWHDEVLAHGDIEDEDRDPVGLPPR